MNLDLSKYVTGLRVDTSMLPPIDIENPFEPGPPSPLLQTLKPKITIRLKGFDPVVIKPYGDPGATKWPVIEVAAIAALMAGIIAVSVNASR